MNMHMTELQTQAQRAKEVKDRINGNVVPVQLLRSAEAKVANLEQMFKSISDDVHSLRQRNSELSEQLSDAHARIIYQAELISALNDAKSPQQKDKRSVQDIVLEVLQDFPGITWDDIIGVRRKKYLIKPRHLCMAAVYMERKDLSFPQMGRIFRRDHSTVLHAINKIGVSRRDEI